MNTKGIKAIEDADCLCFKCLKKIKNSSKIHYIGIGSSGYGSSFDNLSTKLQLCDECFNDSQKENPIWNMETVYGHMHFDKYTKKKDYPEYQIIDEYIDQRYKYDTEMCDYIKKLPLQSRELIWNRYANGACADYNMTGQDWIDFQLDELSHKKCKQYGFYSPEERKAYKERFANCECVKINKYKDGSQGSSCPYGAFGDKDGNVGLNICGNCYICTHYNPRTSDTEIIDKIEEYYKDEKDRLIHMIQYAGSRLRELENSVEKYMDKHK